ncbi:MAG: phytoene/squalene synthase family protein [Phycisphaerae bacterium]|nr:phytoene/squalene synthase family protein [Phycisphaerae bacterium]
MIPAVLKRGAVDADRAAADVVRDICRRHARSFYFASFFLPRRKRLAAYSVYAFCRLLDDATDNNPGGELRGIEGFESALARVYEGDFDDCGDDATAGVMRAFARTVREYDIPRRYFEDLAAGCRMDLSVRTYDTWPQLENYCYHVAGVVGLIMSCIFGPIDEATKPRAIAMGNAMQLTNILRDIGEDLLRGRVYIPREDLERFCLAPADLAAGKVDDRFRGLMSHEIERARALFRTGAEGLCRLTDDGSRLTASAMAVIYAGILRAIERQDYDVFSRRARLSLLQKFARIPAARRLARRREGQPIPDVF